VANALGQLDFLAACAGRRAGRFQTKFPVGRESSRAGSWGHSPHPEKQIGFWLPPLLWFGWQIFSATKNCGCRFDAGNALAIFRLRRVLFSRRAGHWSAEHRLGALEFKLWPPPKHAEA